MRTLAIIFALSVNLATMTAQITVKDVLKSIPNELMPYFNDKQRDEIKQFANDKDTLEIRNVLNGKTTITTLSQNLAEINLNNNTLTQIKLLPVNNTTKIICAIKTIKEPIKESVIKFYSADWQPIKSTFNLPTADNTDSLLALFTQKPDTMTTERYNELSNCIEPVVMYTDISDKDNSVTLSISIPFTANDKSDAIKVIIRKKTFKWDGNTFKNC